MATALNGQHQGPVRPLSRVIVKPEALAREKVERREGRNAEKPKGDPKLEEKRRKAREYYHANKGRIKERYEAKKAGKALRVVPKDDEPPAVPKRPGKVDALICINRSLTFLGSGDLEGAELWSRFAARIIQGKE